MECPRHHLIPPLLLLLGLLAGAAATMGTDAQPCEPTHIATQVALFCASGLPTACCCETVVASVDRSGGLPCLCRVAAQPQAILVSLNASRLLSLYVACGGLYAEGARFVAAAACLGSPPFTVPVIASPPADPSRDQQSPGTPPSDVPGIVTAPFAVPRHRQQTRPPPSVVPIIPVRQAVPLHKLQKRPGPNCNSTLLANELTQSCRGHMKVPSPSCCTTVLMTIDNQDKDCLCRVTETGDMVVSDFLDVRVMWNLYKQCGGRQQAVPKDRDNCVHAPSPPPPSLPPPPPPPSPPAPPPPKMRHRLPIWEVAVIVVGVVVVVAAVMGVTILIWNKVKSKESNKVKSKEKEHEHSPSQVDEQQKESDQQEMKSEENESERDDESEDSEVRVRQVARQSFEIEDQHLGIPPPRQSEKKKILVRVHNRSDISFDREAEYNW